MRIGQYELRKPWVKYVETPIEEQFYWAIRKSIAEDIAKEIEDYWAPNEVLAEGLTLTKVRQIFAAIARGQK